MSFPNTTETYSYGPATNFVIQSTTSDTFLAGDSFQLKIYRKHAETNISITNIPIVVGSIFSTT